MSTGFTACPACQSVILPDTAVCPNCQHVIDEQRAVNQDRGDVSFLSDSEQEVACAHCSEMVRVGLVRCWNCGAFMRDDIAKSYDRMKSKSQPVIYSPLPEEEGATEPVPTAPAESAPAEEGYALQSDSADDDDFEMSVSMAQDDDFELGFADAQSNSSPGVDQATPAANASAPAETADAPADTTATDAAEQTEGGVQESPTDTTTSDDAVAHSTATGGDALLETALEEEAEGAKRRAVGGRRQKTTAEVAGVLVFCPNGHRIEVQERHRGKTGRCPKCKASYTVPLPEAGSEQESQEAETAKPQLSEAGTWVTNLRLHSVDPLKMKLKPNSLAATFDVCDLWCRPEGYVLFQLAKPGLFGAPDKKTLAAAREKLHEQIDEEVPLSDLPVVNQWEFDGDSLQLFKVAQPAPYAHESPFAGIAVFGEGKIAVLLPIEDPKLRRYVSCTLSVFRKLSRALQSDFQIEHFGADVGIPLEDECLNVACHYTEQLLKPLEHVEFYEADEDVELELIGWKCSGCGLVVCEDARKKEKIGGAAGRGIAKAKCPKCSQKFGSNPLHVRKNVPEEPADEETELAETASPS